MIAKAWFKLRYTTWRIMLTPYAAGVRREQRRQAPRHTRDLFGRPGATATDGLGLDTIPEGVLRRDFDWPTDDELWTAELGAWDATWKIRFVELDERLAKDAHDGNLRLAAAGIPLDVIVEHSVAEVQRHERALAVASRLTGEWPALVGAS